MGLEAEVILALAVDIGGVVDENVDLSVTTPRSRPTRPVAVCLASFHIVGLFPPGRPTNCDKGMMKATDGTQNLLRRGSVTRSAAGTVCERQRTVSYRAFLHESGSYPIYQPFVTGSGPASAQHPALTWVNTILGNIKRSLHGTYHHLSSKHLPRYLAEFSYRFNRRFSLREMFPRLAFVALRTAPMPYRVLKLAENFS